MRKYLHKVRIGNSLSLSITIIHQNMLICIELRAICISNRCEHCKSYYYNGISTQKYETCLCPFLFIFLLRSIDPMIADNYIRDCSKLSQAPCFRILFCSSFMMLFHLHSQDETLGRKLIKRKSTLQNNKNEIGRAHV